jgi:hypothetical protein
MNPNIPPNVTPVTPAPAVPTPPAPALNPAPANQQLSAISTVDHGERYWLILQNIVDWLRFSETKASIILTSYGVLFTIFYANAVAVFSSVRHPGAVRVFVILFGIASLSSIIAAFLTIRPRLSNNNPTSILYFRHIQKKYKTAKEYKQAAHAILDSEDQYTDHLTEQIHTISKVADSKYVCAGLAIWAFGVSLVLLVITVVTYVSVNLLMPAK